MTILASTTCPHCATEDVLRVVRSKTNDEYTFAFCECMACNTILMVSIVNRHHDEETTH